MLSWLVVDLLLKAICYCQNLHQLSFENNICIVYVQTGETGRAIGIEHITELVDMAQVNLQKDNLTARLMETGRVKFVVGDGRKGYESAAPFDAIHVGAAAPKIPQPVSECSVKLGIAVKFCYLCKLLLNVYIVI